MSLRRMEVMNPGPADLLGVQLEVTVPERCELEKPGRLTCAGGLVIRTSPAISVACRQYSSETCIVFTPDAGHSNGALNANQWFWVDFESPRGDWRPAKAEVVLPGQREFDADRELPSDQGRIFGDSLMRAVPILLLVILALWWMASHSWRRTTKGLRDELAKFPEKLEREMAKRMPEIWSDAWNACLTQQEEKPTSPVGQAQLEELRRQITAVQIDESRKPPRLRGGSAKK
jgi:hypothetical protein